MCMMLGCTILMLGRCTTEWLPLELPGAGSRLLGLYVKLLLVIYVMGTLYDARKLLGRVLAC